MNERNQEFIVDLLGGRLSPDEERAALALIETDPDLRAEYEAQLSAISILGASSPPMMTMEERTALHATLRQQLHLDDALIPVVAAPSRWQRWWAPLGGLAVAAVVIFGAVVVLPGALSGSDSDETLQMAAAETTTTAASTTDDVAGGIEGESAGDQGVGVAAQESLETSPIVEESADAETQAAESFDTAAVASALPYLTDVDLDMLENDLTSDPDSLRNSAPPRPTKSAEPDPSQVDACLDSIRADNPLSEISPIALTAYEGIESVVVSVTPSDGDSFLTVYSIAECRELASTQG